MLQTPLLFLIFNRPAVTEETFAKIRKQQPRYLYIASDGPRENNPSDTDLNNECKQIVSNIDWDCEVKTLFQTKNLGCGLAPATAITWFFNQVDEGIILEDDCLPNDSFFKFCENLLSRYRGNLNIMMICGTSYQPKPLNTSTYYFSKYPHVWGWATWKRAWADYNFKLDGESDHTRAAVINKTFSSRNERTLWENNLKMILGGLDAWDYQLMYWMWKNDRICIVPWRNMIANIGFGSDATHTYDASSKQSKMTQYKIETIKHPRSVVIHKRADNYERKNILVNPIANHYFNRLKQIMRGFLQSFS